MFKFLRLENGNLLNVNDVKEIVKREMPLWGDRRRYESFF